MKKILILFIAILSYEKIFSLEIKDEVTQKANELILQGIEELHNGQYDVCLTTFQEIQQLLPAHPAGYFFLCRRFGMDHGRLSKF